MIAIGLQELVELSTKNVAFSDKESKEKKQAKSHKFPFDLIHTVHDQMMEIIAIDTNDADGGVETLVEYAKRLDDKLLEEQEGSLIAASLTGDGVPPTTVLSKAEPSPVADAPIGTAAGKIACPLRVLHWICQ